MSFHSKGYHFMRALITGASGFIGRNLLKRLLLLENQFEEIITVTRNPFIIPNKKVKNFACDLGDSKKFGIKDPAYAAIAIEKPDVIFHLASKPVVKFEDGENPFKIIDNNITSTYKVCEYAPKGSRVVMASSVIVYGDWMFDEDQKDLLSPLVPYSEEDKTKPTSIYGMTKRASESILDVYNELGISCASARLCATVGEGLTHGVIKDFIRKLNTDSDMLDVLGDAPGSTKPYLHIDDALSALIKISQTTENEHYNVCPDDQINIADVADAVMTGTDIHKPLNWLGEGANWKGDNRIITVSNKKLRSIGWEPKFPKSKEVIIDIVRKIGG